MPAAAAAQPDTLDEEVIEDPELAGAPRSPLPEPPTAPAPQHDTFALWLHSRTSVDVTWDDAEDVLEVADLASFEARHHRSERLGFALGLRARHVLALERPSAPGQPDRHELDVAPTAAYADAGIADGVHLRAGYQVTPLGRFDVFGSSNVLAVYDLRSGPAVVPGAADVAQPALRLDLEPATWLSVRALYVPFFTPHAVAVTGSDYAMLRALDSVRTADGAPATQALDDALERAGLSGSQSFRLLGPEPGPEQPQGALRATARFGGGEVALTGATALEHLPAVVVSPALAGLLADPRSPAAAAALLSDPEPVRIDYGRFALLALDAALDAGPLQLGAELSYAANRSLLAARAGQPPEMGTTDFAHAALRAELIEGESLVVAAETFVASALDDPRDPQRRWLALEQGRFWRGAALGARWQPGALALELAGVAFSGPTWFLAPRLEWTALDELRLELGGVLVDGPAPGELGSPNVAIGGVYGGNDQVYVGARWIP
jgi:hypothetical protein